MCVWTCAWLERRHRRGSRSVLLLGVLLELSLLHGHAVLLHLPQLPTSTSVPNPPPPPLHLPQEYKSAASFLVNSQATGAEREALRSTLASLSAQVVQGIAQGRGLTEKKVRAELP